jgi:hypothetical protein
MLYFDWGAHKLIEMRSFLLSFSSFFAFVRLTFCLQHNRRKKTILPALMIRPGKGFIFLGRCSQPLPPGEVGGEAGVRMARHRPA